MRNFFAKHQKVLTQYVMPILGGLVALSVLWFVVGSRDKSGNEIALEASAEQEASESAEKKEAPISSQVAVYIAGGVKNPGVYRLPAEALVADAVDAAGGFSKESDQTAIEHDLNLAQPISEGMKIYVPKKGDKVADDVSSSTASSPGSSGSDSGKVSINNASKSELMDLYGIGEVYSQKIIDNRPYSSAEELVEREVIPNATYEKIKEEISL